MKRRIFISYQHKDQMKAKGFNLLRWNKNVDLEFVGRHLLDPVDSKNEDYIKSKISDEIKGTSATVVLLGKETFDSEWVAWEIEKSLNKDNPNGVLAIRLDKDAPLPDDSAVGIALKAAAAEVIDWDVSEFEGAIDRACRAANRVQAIKAAVGGGSDCGR